MARKPRKIEELLPLLDEYASDIARNGSIEYRAIKNNKPFWCVRFRLKTNKKGKYRRKSICLGTDQRIADAVGYFIAEHRSKRADEREKRREHEDNIKRVRKENREFAKLMRVQNGLSRRSTREVRRRLALEPSGENTMFLMKHGLVPRPRPRGRPLKQRLW